MAARSASLSIRVLVDAAQGAQQLGRLSDEAEGVGDSFKKMLGAAAAFAGVTGFIKGAVDAASKLQQSTGGVEAVFKSSSSSVKQFATDAAQALGLSRSAYQDLATVIGSQLKNAGVSMDQLAPKTDQIITKGADLAAMFGGTTAEAVDALSSALKGERDPIEKYGISLNQASIDAEIMAQGLDTSTTAAKTAATQQATLALIYKQSADAQGAAAREADSYASVMQQLNAVWENTMADVGTALLPLMSSLGKALQDLAPAASAILGPMASFVALVTQLPTPILAVVAGMALWKFTPISAMLTSLGNSMRGATSSAAGFKSAMAGVGKALAGGALLGGAMLLFSALAENTAQAEAGVKEFGGVVTTLGDQLVKTGGQADQAFKDLQRSTIENTDAFQALTAAGVSYGDAMNFMTDQSKLTAAGTQSVQDALNGMDEELAISAAAMSRNGDQAGKYAQEKMAFLAAEQAATAGTQDNTAATQEAAAAQAKAEEETRKANEAAAKLAASQTQVSVAMDTTKASSEAASRALDFFTLAMDKAAGRQTSLEQASLAVQSGLADTAKAFKDSAEAGTLSADQLAAWDYAALQSTDSGRQVFSSLTDMRSAYDTATTAAYSNAVASGDAAGAIDAATAAASSIYGQFINMATAAGLGADQAAALAAKLGIVDGTEIDPKVFEVTAQDAQAQAALLAAQGAVIDPKSFDVTADPSAAQSTVGSLVGQSLKNTVNLLADPKSAESTINGVVSEKRTTTPVNVTADPSQANSTVNGFTQTQRSTQVKVTADTMAAQGAITALVTQQRTLTITVAANTSPALQAINSIINGNYTATINVTANTSAARAAVASVPTTVGAPAALMALGAAPEFTPAPPPPMRLVGTLGAVPPSQSVTYEINVSNTLDSADSIARRVIDVIERRERRINGIRVAAR
jgi:hypothetical protein